MIKAIRPLLVLAFAYLIATSGAWIAYPEHFTKPDLIIQIWQHFGLSIPTPVFLSTIAGTMFAVLMLVQPQNNGKYGKAIWGGKETAKELKLNGKEGVIFGKLNNTLLILDEPLSALVLAPPGTGKTAAIAIPTLLKTRHSVMVHDPKGELFETTAPTRSKFSVIRYFNPTDPNSHTFNIFDRELLPEEKLDYRGYIENQAHTIIKTGRKGEDYFTKAAREAFTFFGAWLIWQNEQTSIPEIRSKILSSPDIGNTVEEMMQEADEDTNIDDFIKQQLLEDGRSVLIAANSEEQWAGVMGTLTTALQPFSDPRIARATSGRSDINGNQLKEENTSIYLVVPDKDKDRLSPIMAMLFESIGAQLISKMPVPGQIPITFVMDEFVRLGKLKTIKDLPAISRGYLLNTIFIAQDYEQLSETYDKESIGIFNSTCAFKVIFRQNNHNTAETISKTIGDKTDIKTSINKSLKGFFSKETSTSVSEEGQRLVTAQDILNLGLDECLILGQGQFMKPIKAKNLFWFKDKKLLQTVEANKPLLDILRPE